MVYRVIGLMSGSSLDGLDIAFVEFHESAGKWSYELKASDCYPYDKEWMQKLRTADTLPAIDYALLDTEYGYYTAELVNRFIRENNLEYQVQLIASHGHTTFHIPGRQTTGQIGSGAVIAAATGINVVSDLRAMDLALGGQGAPIVPIGEKLLFGDFPFFLNIGGIANISFNGPDKYIAFDICSANRILNRFASSEGMPYDDEGRLAASGNLNESVLRVLGDLEYYSKPYPKSLSNSFGTDVVYPLVKGSGSTTDILRTYVEHIAIQVKNALQNILAESSYSDLPRRMMITGGGAHNRFLVERIREQVLSLGLETMVPDKKLIEYKEAIVMALIGVLRWREENNVFSSVTGSRRNSIGGAVWIGQEA